MVKRLVVGLENLDLRARHAQPHQPSGQLFTEQTEPLDDDRGVTDTLPERLAHLTRADERELFA